METHPCITSGSKSHEWCRDGFPRVTQHFYYPTSLRRWVVVFLYSDSYWNQKMSSNSMWGWFLAKWRIFGETASSCQNCASWAEVFWNKLYWFGCDDLEDWTILPSAWLDEQTPLRMGPPRKYKLSGFWRGECLLDLCVYHFTSSNSLLLIA